MPEDNATKRTMRIRKAIAFAEQLTHDMCGAIDPEVLHELSRSLREQASIIHMYTAEEG